MVPLRPSGTPAPAEQATGASGRAASRIQEIRFAVERNSSKAALEKAKQLYKELPSDETKSVLIDAYFSRIEAMLSKDLTAEAKALTDLVVSRFPEAADRLGHMQRDLAAKTGDVAFLVAPLADPNLPAEKRQAAERTIRHGLTDMQALAACPALPPDHPLRTAAAAVARAFAAVTTGDVDDAAVSLPEVSHRSPLADWKHLIRAIQALYHGRDDDCRRLLAAIDADSAPAKVADSVRTILAESAEGHLSPAGRSLVQRVLGSRGELRTALRSLDDAFSRRDSRGLYPRIRQAVLACDRVYPQLLKRLKQHISVKATMADRPPEAVLDAMGGPSVHDAYFYRLFARATEGIQDSFHACVLWDRFRRAALAEGLFAADGQENAFLYLHMAELLRRIPPEHLFEMQQDYREDMADDWDDFDEEEESAPLSRLASRSSQKLNLYFLYPEKLYERAVSLRSDAGIYKEWLDYARMVDRPEVKPDEIAQMWASAFPQDERPLLHLAESAEQRNAFDKALKYIQRAEALGGIDPKVRRARFRLLVAKAVRHLKQAKSGLAAKDFAQIDELPQAGEKDRPAFVASLRWINAMLEDNRADADRLHEQIRDLLGGPVAAAILLLSAARECEYPSPKTKELEKWLTAYKERDIVGAIVHTYPIGMDVGIAVLLPAKWASLLAKWFKRSDCELDAAGLLTMARAALAVGWLDVAYYCSGYGLQRTGPEQARFLFLRGRSLPFGLEDRRQECFAAATELARRVRDMDLVAEIADAAREELSPWEWSDPFGPDLNDRGMDDETLRRVTEFERRTQSYPKGAGRAPFDIGQSPFVRGQCQCPSCRRARGETGGAGTSRRRRARPVPEEDYLFDDLFEEDDLDEEAIEAASRLPGMPLELVNLMGEILRLNGGRLPTTDKEIERFALRHPELVPKLTEIMLNLPEMGPDAFDEFGPDDEPPDRPFFPRRRRGRRKKRR